ncbi:MAG: rod shape-determining protein MreC [Candidatus Levybacteria bacterium]|nr:rod shape-determining protein MreC [Candidatus Levybacteria bacterium]
MQKRRGLSLTALLFLILSVFLLTVFRSPVFFVARGTVELVVAPLQRTVYSAFGGFSGIGGGDRIRQLEEENSTLWSQSKRQKTLETEVKALRDQFQTADPQAKTLLPATVIGLKGFLPGISLPSEIVLDKGFNDSIEKGYIVVYKDNLLGIVTKVTPHVSLVKLVTDSNISFTARTAQTNAFGVVSGQANGVMLLKNVVLSDKLTVNDLVVTKGDRDENGKGYPPDLIVGKIISVDKKASALFQSAQVRGLVDIARIPIVFIITAN